MKTFKILVMFLGSMLNFNLSATEVKSINLGNITAKVETVCIKGYLFAVVVSTRGDVSITQVFQRFNSFANPAAPVRCKD